MRLNRAGKKISMSNFSPHVSLLLLQAMRFIFLFIFIFFFVIMPMYLLNTFVMPEINGIESSYANAGKMADNIAAGSTTTTTIAR
jgi:hypothetical protein